MLSSTDVSALFAAQNAQFAQTNAYAQQLGMNAPQSGGFFRPPPSFPGLTPPPPSFSYAPSGMRDPRFGDRMAGGAMSALGAGASFGGAALGAASMFGKLGAVAPLVDPFAGAMAGFGAAGLGGAAMGAALPLALGYGASKMVGSFVHGGQQQSAMNTTLQENFSFVNPASRTGQGFDRTAMAGIGQIVRQIANVPEMMTSVEELTRMIPKLRQMGSMQGVRDLQEFSRRFKEQVGTIRDMSKMLGTTMEEAADMFAHSKAVGMRTPSQMMQNTLNVQFTAAQTGMSTGQVMGMQSAGANMATQMGIRRSVGSTAITNIAQMLQKGVDTNRLSQADLEDLTGAQGPEAMSAGAQMMASRLVQTAQGTSAGRLMMFGLAKFDPSGRYAGIDEELARGLQTGSIGREELMRRASKLTSQQKMSASGHIGSMSMELAGKVGPAGFGQFLKGVVGARYGENGTQLLMTKLGMSENEADITERMSGMAGQGDEDKDLLGNIRRREASIKDRTDPKAIWERVKTKLHRESFGKLEEAGSKFHEQMGRAIDNFVDDVTGRAVVSMSESGAKRLAGAFGPAGKQVLDDMLKQAGGSQSQMSVSAALGGGGLLGKITDTEMAASLMGGDRTTGRTSRGQFAHSAKALGIDTDSFSGLSNSAVERSLSQRQKIFEDLGKGMSGTAGDLIRRVRGTREGSDWENMSAEKQRDLLAESINTQLDEDRKMKMWTGKTGDLTTATSAIAKKAQDLNADKGTAIATAMLASVGTKVSARDEVEGLLGDANIHQLSATMKDRESELVKTIGADSAALIKAKPELAKALAKMTGPGGAEVQAILQGGGSTEEKVKKLKEHGIDVSPADIASLTSISVDLVKDGRNEKGGMDAINSYVQASAATDLKLFTESATKASQTVGDTQLGGALADLGSAKTKDEINNAYQKVNQSFRDVEKRLMGAKTDDERKKILSGLGQFAGGAATAMQIGKGLKGTMNVKDLAQRIFGSSDQGSIDELMADSSIKVVGGKVQVNDQVRSEAAALAAEHAGASSVLRGGKAAGAGDTNTEILQTLKKLDDTISKNSTIIAGYVTGDTSLAKKYLTDMQSSARPDGSGTPPAADKKP